jgi:hypothetical protein
MVLEYNVAWDPPPAAKKYTTIPITVPAATPHPIEVFRLLWGAAAAAPVPYVVKYAILLGEKK